MKLAAKFSLFILVNLLILSCNDKPDQIEFTVKNNLNLNRKSETVSISLDQIGSFIKEFGTKNLMIKDETGNELLTQTIDNNADGTIDELIFQIDLKANEEKKLRIEKKNGKAEKQPDNKLTTFSRFVPERIDDYAWENDRVAFRTYGPAAQRLVENNNPDGIISSGIDAWLKRVSYPVINKWYKNGHYHTDTGEGYDSYDVSGSRGVGGIGVWMNDSLYVSKNFTDFKRITIGPIRTIFELTYAPWKANGLVINEKKRISLDLGSNLNRIEVKWECVKPIPNCAIGISLHDKSGETRSEPEAGWFRYWEPVDDSSMGTGIVVDPTVVQGYKDYRTDIPNQSHLLVLTRTTPKIIYYAGFGWDKSGQFKSLEDWDTYLGNFSKRLKSPLKIHILKQD